MAAKTIGRLWINQTKNGDDYLNGHLSCPCCKEDVSLKFWKSRYEDGPEWYGTDESIEPKKERVVVDDKTKTGDDVPYDDDVPF